MKLDQRTCKRKTRKGKLGRDSLTQLIIQNQQMQASAKSGNSCLATIIDPDLGFVAAKIVK